MINSVIILAKVVFFLYIENVVIVVEVIIIINLEIDFENATYINSESIFKKISLGIWKDIIYI